MKETNKMKKLMIAAAIVCAAAMAQASAWSWETSGMSAGKVWWDNGSTANLKSTTANAMIYLFDAAVIDQDTLLSGLRDNTYSDLSKATSVSSTTLDSDSKLVAKSIASYGGESGNYNFYMAVMDTAGNVFLSGSIPAAAQKSSEAPITFGDIKTNTQKSWTSDATFTFAGDGGKGAGWYAVPEPTSGLLLLLGVAGLALKRKRA